MKPCAPGTGCTARCFVLSRTNSAAIRAPCVLASHSRIPPRPRSVILIRALRDFLATSQRAFSRRCFHRHMTPTPRWFRLTLAIAAGVIVALALVAAGCGGSGSSSDASGTGTTSTTATPSSNGSNSAFAECLKENGVEGFDPGSSPQGGPPQNLDPAAFQKAMQACGSLRPQGQGFGGPGQNGQSSAQAGRASVVLEEARHRELLAGLRAERRRSAEAAGRDAGLRRSWAGRWAARGRKWRGGRQRAVRCVLALYEQARHRSAGRGLGHPDRRDIREVQAGAEGLPVASQRE